MRPWASATSLEVPLPTPSPHGDGAPRRSTGQPADVPLAETAPRRRAGLLLGLAAVVLAADLVSKLVVVATLQDGPPVRLLGGLLTLTHARNPGAAFSIGTNATLLFTVVAVVVVLAVLRVVPQVRHGGWALALGLLLGGALGNLVDRLFRDPGPLRGAVVDWIRVPYWPTFNLADCGIVVGGLLAALLSVRGVGLDGTRHDDDHAAEGPPAARPEPGPPR